MPTMNLSCHDRGTAADGRKVEEDMAGIQLAAVAR